MSTPLATKGSIHTIDNQSDGHIQPVWAQGFSQAPISSAQLKTYAACWPKANGTLGTYEGNWNHRLTLLIRYSSSFSIEQVGQVLFHCVGEVERQGQVSSVSQFWYKIYTMNFKFGSAKIISVRRARAEEVALYEGES